MTEVCRTDNFITTIYDDPDNQTFEQTIYSNGVSTKHTHPLYNIIKIHRIDTDDAIALQKEYTLDPSSRMKTTDNFIAKKYDDPDNETYEQTIYSNGVSMKHTHPLYNIIKIHRIDTDEVIASYKECTRGPSYMMKKFVKINNVQWFIGCLNYRVMCYINCETGKLIIGKEAYEIWYNIKSISPNGTLAIINEYVYGGNAEYDRIYDLSQLDTVGPILRNVENLPDIFDESYPELFTLELISDTEVRAMYKWYYEGEWRDMGVYRVK